MRIINIEINKEVIMETRSKHVSELLANIVSRTTSFLTVVVILVLLLTTACSQSSIEDYQEALQKTESIQRGKTQTQVDVTMGFRKDGLDEETTKQLKSFEAVSFEGVTSFDSTGQEVKVSSLNLFSLGGLGLNFDYYQDGDQTALYVPMLGKYLNLSTGNMKELSGDDTVLAKYESMNLTQETISAIEVLWSQTFEADEVVKGEKSTMETPEGDVRVVKFTITPEKEKLKAFVISAVEIVMEDEKIKENIKAYSNSVEFKDGNIVNVEDLVNGLEEAMASWDINKFEVVDFIDVDGYIVESNTSIGLSINTVESGAIESFEMKVVSKNYDIEKPQDIQFPELTDENSLTIDELQKGLPSTYENLLN